MRGALCLLLCAAVFLSGCLSPAATPPVNNPPSPPPAVHGTLTVAFVNVGQGDGTVWQLPDGSIIVYDCGPPAGNASQNPVVQYLTAIGHAPGSKLFALIASHGHLDHIGGCEEVLAAYEVQHIYEVWYEGSDAPNSYNRWITDLINENATVHTARSTQFLDGEQVFHQWDALALPQAAFDDGLRAQIFWPPNAQVPTWSDIGFYSLAIRWSFGTIDFCIDGDIESAQESTLSAAGHDLNCEVYLVGHHGSAHSSSSPWLSKMQPKVAPVSFGENDYGHPTAEALCRVQHAGAKVYATQRLGTITLSTDGTFVTVSPDGPEGLDYCAKGANYWSTVTPPPPVNGTPPPSGNSTFTVDANALPTDPCQYTTVDVRVHASRGGSAVAGASVTSTWHYKTSSPSVSGTTDSYGDTTLSRYISGASAGYEVVVSVSATEGGQTASASTSFTPKVC